MTPEPIPFERFMEVALYGPDGFYTGSAGGSAGRRGDFITSPEVGPLFGAVLARYLDAEWDRIGRPGNFTVVDAGAGPGTLARSILAAQPQCAAPMRYIAIEVSGAQRERHPDGVESVGVIPPATYNVDVNATENSENLPLRLALYYDGGGER
jgi:SAM-dependent MidA family methyltransferase